VKLFMLAAIACLLCQQQLPPRDTRPAANTATGRIAGLVSTDDAQPRPLRRARVTLTGASLETGWSVITSDDGTFAFDGLPAGRYAVGALKEGYVPMNYGATRTGRPGRGVPVADRQTVTLTLRLPRGGVITGTVLDVDGQPAQGIAVSAMSRRFSGASITGDFTYSTSGAPSQAMTDDKGVYRIYGLPAGDYIISARPLGVTPSVQPRIIAMLGRGGTLGRPMAPSQVFHPGGTDVARAARVAVRAGEERVGIDVQLEYAPLATISGTAPVQSPDARVRVKLWRAEEATVPPNGAVVTADAQGRFRFGAVPPGTYHVSARAAQSSDTPGGRSDGPVDARFAAADVVVNGEDIDIALAPQPPISLSGRIVFDSHGAAPPQVPPQFRANVPAVLNPSSGGWPLPPLVLEGTSFHLDGIAAGTYRTFPSLQGIRTPIGGWWLVSLIAGGRDLLDAPLNIQQSVSDAVATFTDRPASVGGALRDEQGSPAGDAWVVAFPADRSFWFVGSRRITAVRSGREGKWGILNMPPGEYRVVATTDVDQGDWFDPAVLERLAASAVPLTIAAGERKTLDLILR
jgi:Carboxypeptidase regulatory-like domain